MVFPLSFLFSCVFPSFVRCSGVLILNFSTMFLMNLYHNINDVTEFMLIGNYEYDKIAFCGTVRVHLLHPVNRCRLFSVDFSLSLSFSHWYVSTSTGKSLPLVSFLSSLHLDMIGFVTILVLMSGHVTG